MIQENRLFLFIALIFAVVPIALVACGGDADGGEGDGQEWGAPCDFDHDCEVGQVCDWSVDRCRVGCDMDTDCGAGQVCDPDSKKCRSGCIFHSECGEGEVCDDEIKACRPGCSRDEHCEEGEVCDPDTLTCEAACIGEEDCADGEFCLAGLCRDSAGRCRDHFDCAEGAYCRDRDHSCIDVTCGSDYNPCDACTSGPNGGAGDPDGPLIFRSVYTCGVSPIHVECNDGELRCELEFFAWDPNGDLPVENMQDYIYGLEGHDLQGKEVRYYEGISKYNVIVGCYTDKSDFTDVTTTLYIKNSKGMTSNTLCFTY